jgi:hypothetical protein
LCSTDVYISGRSVPAAAIEGGTSNSTPLQNCRASFRCWISRSSLWTIFVRFCWTFYCFAFSIWTGVPVIIESEGSMMTSSVDCRPDKISTLSP